MRDESIRNPFLAGLINGAEAVGLLRVENMTIPTLSDFTNGKKIAYGSGYTIGAGAAPAVILAALLIAV
jgi:hypothetical protein